MNAAPSAGLSPPTARDAASRIDLVVRRAMPLWARSGGTAPSPAVPEDRVRRWEQVLGGRQSLRRRLANCRLDLEPRTHLAAEGNARAPDAERWVRVLTGAVAAASDAASVWPPAVRDAAVHPANPIPFEELLVGFMTVAREELGCRGGDALGVLGPVARAGFERQLLAHLSYVASLALGLEWYAYRFARAPAASLEQLWSSQPPSNALYRGFVDALRADGLLTTFETYPVLARLLAQSVANWADGVAEFCQRFQRDRPSIQRELAGGDLPERAAITAVLPDRSDRHRGGRTVVICKLADGASIVYKPRPVAPERAFHRLVDMLNGFGLSLRLARTSIVDCGTHGWASFAPSASCTSPEEAGRYYRRAGMLLCLLHVMAVSDVHYENLVSAGEHPIVVDAETLLDVPATPSPGRLASVLATGMLPQPAAADGGGRDLSALAARSVDAVGFRTPQWAQVNTDQMSLLDEEDGGGHASRDPAPAPAPGPGVVAADHIDDVTDGFQEAYLAVHRHADRIARDGVLRALIDAAAPRVLLRNTATYAALQHHLLAPEPLRDGLDWGIELEWLAKPLSAPSLADPRMVEVYDRERSAMEQLDVPYFSALPPCDGDTGPADSEFARLFLRERSALTFQANLEALGAEGLNAQLRAIRESLGSRPQPAAG
jgi:type 2 lantibiotic biosynthesis protein LanM